MTDQNDRVKGYVVAGDKKGKGPTVWKVRVKDEHSQHNGRKFVVASTHNDITLARGIDVTFLVGSMDGPNKGRKLLKAVDVQLQKDDERSKGD